MAQLESFKPEKILIVMMGGIGNMIFLTPALRALRKACPSSKIHFLLGPYGAEKVLEGSPLIDKKIIIGDGKYRGIRGKIKLIRELGKENFSLSIASTGTNPVKTGLLCYLARIPLRLGEDIGGKGWFYNLKIDFDSRSHEVETNISLVQSLGIKVDDKSLCIFLSDDDRTYARRFFAQNSLEGRRVIGMHPGSGVHQASFKRWPKENFARLADWIMSHCGASVILFGGAEETSLAEEISSLMTSSPLLMTGKTTLGQTAALIAKCSLFLSNDSGLLHVATAVQTPAIGIYGPTNVARTGPYSDSAVIIRKDLSCSPCYKGKSVRCDHLKCLKSVTVDDVRGEVQKMIDRHGL